MSAKELVKRLILYVEHKKKSNESPSGVLHMYEAAHLRKKLLAEGVDPELLEMSGEGLEERIYESIASQVRR